MSWDALREKYDALVDDNLRHRARLLIVTGYIMSALGLSVDAANTLINSHSYSWPDNLSNVISLLYPLSWFASAWAFWWLSKVTIVGAFQISMIRRAYIGFAVQSSLLAAVFVLGEVVDIAWRNLFFIFGPWWFATSQWLTGLGGVVTAIGFILLVRVFSPVQPLYTKRDRI